MNKLRRFIESELDARHWDAAELTRRSKLSRQVVHGLLNDRRRTLKMQPRDATVRGLSKAFGMDEKHIRLVALQAMEVIPDDLDLVIVHELRQADNAALLSELAERLRPKRAPRVTLRDTPSLRPARPDTSPEHPPSQPTGKG